MKKSLYLVLAMLWMALIWLLSSLPAKELPDVEIMGIDKLAHFSIYFIWGLLVNLYLIKRKGSLRAYLMAYTLMLISAALDEYHQILIPGRSVSIYDFLANSSGLIAALAIGRILCSRRQL